LAPRISLGKFRRTLPEVWFRIIHLSADHVKSCAELREQTVEVALGPDRAFENGNIGVLTRCVPASQVVCAIPPRRHPAKGPKPPKKTGPSSAARFLRLAQKWQRQLDAGEIESQAAIARREGLTRARVTQIMSLLRLAHEVQKKILEKQKTKAAAPLSERALRSLAAAQNATEQMDAFRGLTEARA